MSCLGGETIVQREEGQVQQPEEGEPADIQCGQDASDTIRECADDAHAIEL